MWNYGKQSKCFTYKWQSLGLDAQKDIISTYVTNAGGTIIFEAQEKESGKDVSVLMIFSLSCFLDLKMCQLFLVQVTLSFISE